MNYSIHPPSPPTPLRAHRSQSASHPLSRLQAVEMLRRQFGFRDFADRQWEAIEALLRGDRVLSIERTGFGKSLIYQFAAVQLPGITLVFSPLVALMHDQVRSLKLKGIPAGYLNYTQTEEEQQAVIEAAMSGQIKLLYAAPERDSDRRWKSLIKKLDVRLVVVDEAHCISTWGHDFRPAYRRISEHLSSLLPGIPVFACTATATHRTESDILKQLRGGSADRPITCLRGPLTRSNLKLDVLSFRDSDEKQQSLLRHVRRAISKGENGLVYAGTQKETERLALFLRASGIDAVAYHGGMRSDLRRSIEARWAAGEFKLVVCTNALGMGIDKPDIRFIYHFQIPASPLHYYQEIGRAGRDGADAEAILFYRPADDRLIHRFIDSAQPSTRKYVECIESLSSGLGEQRMMKKLRIGKDGWKTMKQELIDQQILRVVSAKARIVPDPPAFNSLHIENIRLYKLSEFEAMRLYTSLKGDRMKFLVRYLDERKAG